MKKCILFLIYNKSKTREESDRSLEKLYIRVWPGVWQWVWVNHQFLNRLCANLTFWVFRRPLLEFPEKKKMSQIYVWKKTPDGLQMRRAHAAGVTDVGGGARVLGCEVRCKSFSSTCVVNSLRKWPAEDLVCGIYVHITKL